MVKTNIHRKNCSYNDFLFTVFVGKDVDPEERAKVEEYVSSHFPDVECYFLEGGQEVYPYLFVAE